VHSSNSPAVLSLDPFPPVDDNVVDVVDVVDVVVDVDVVDVVVVAADDDDDNDDDDNDDDDCEEDSTEALRGMLTLTAFPLQLVLVVLGDTAAWTSAVEGISSWLKLVYF